MEGSVLCTAFTTQGTTSGHLGDVNLSQGTSTQILTYTLPFTHYEQFRDETWPTMYVFVLWEETKVLWGNPKTHASSVHEATKNSLQLFFSILMSNWHNIRKCHSVTTFLKLISAMTPDCLAHWTSAVSHNGQNVSHQTTKSNSNLK